MERIGDLVARWLLAVAMATVVVVVGALPLPARAPADSTSALGEQGSVPGT